MTVLLENRGQIAQTIARVVADELECAPSDIDITPA